MKREKERKEKPFHRSASATDGSVRESPLFTRPSPRRFSSIGYPFRNSLVSKAFFHTRTRTHIHAQTSGCLASFRCLVPSPFYRLLCYFSIRLPQSLCHFLLRRIKPRNRALCTSLYMPFCAVRAKKKKAPGVRVYIGRLKALHRRVHF